MSKLGSYLSQRAKRKADKEEAEAFNEAADGGQSKREAMERHRAWRARMLPWGMAFIAAAGLLVHLLR